MPFALPEGKIVEIEDRKGRVSLQYFSNQNTSFLGNRDESNTVRGQLPQHELVTSRALNLNSKQECLNQKPVSGFVIHSHLWIKAAQSTSVQD